MIMYQGRYKDGAIILPEQEKALIPENANIIIAILNDDMVLRTKPNIKISEKNADISIAEKQHEAFKKFITAIDLIDDEPITDENITDFNRKHINFRKEF